VGVLYFAATEGTFVRKGDENERTILSGIRGKQIRSRVVGLYRRELSLLPFSEIWGRKGVQTNRYKYCHRVLWLKLIVLDLFLL
jgi:hypothetical protein